MTLERKMYTHILIATDGSELAQKAVDHGLSLARKLGSRVTVMTVTEPFPAYAFAGDMVAASAIDWEAYRESGRQRANQILDAAKAQAQGMQVASEGVHVEDRLPAEAILETAESRDCNLIVMASHGRRGLRRLLLGSQTNEVLTHGSLPVLVVRDITLS